MRIGLDPDRAVLRKAGGQVGQRGGANDGLAGLCDLRLRAHGNGAV